jgi:hypothetical protein
MPTWWIKDADPSGKRMRGRLLYAFVPHFDQIPLTLVAEGRKDPTNHQVAKFRAEPLAANSTYKVPTIPVAGLTPHKGEVHLVSRAKRRPVLVLSAGRDELPESYKKVAPRWQFSRSMLVAPYYGADQDGSRAGFDPSIVAKIRRCKFRQFFWDRLPLNDVKESVMRLDQIQPIGTEPDSYTATDYRLSDDALELMDEWTEWLFTGQIPKQGVLEVVLETIAEVAAAAQ